METPKAKPKKTLQQKIVEKEVRGFPYVVIAFIKVKPSFSRNKNTRKPNGGGSKRKRKT